MASGGSEKFMFSIGDGRNENSPICMALLEGNAAPMLSQKEGDRDNLKFRIKGVAATGVKDARALTQSTGVA